MENNQHPLEEKLDIITKSLQNIEKAVMAERKKSIIHGIWMAIGYVIGLIIAIVIGGWLLTFVGTSFGLGPEAESLKEMLYHR